MHKLKMGLAVGVAAAGLLLGSYSLSAKEQPIGIPMFMAMPTFFVLGSPQPRLYYLGSTTSTTNGTAFSFTNFDISAAPEHANRCIVVGCAGDINIHLSGTWLIDGAAVTLNIGDQLAKMIGKSKPTGSTVDISVSGFGSTASFITIAVFAIYPSGGITQLDNVELGAGTTATKSYTADLNVSNGGVVIFISNSVSNTSSVHSWTGTDAIVEVFDTVMEGTHTVSAGYILTGDTLTTHDLSATRGTSGTNWRGVALSWAA